MKTGFVQIFDTQADAEEALGNVHATLPGYSHRIVDSCQQVQVRSRLQGADQNAVYGAPDAQTTYLVLSLPN